MAAQRIAPIFWALIFTSGLGGCAPAELNDGGGRRGPQNQDDSDETDDDGMTRPDGASEGSVGDDPDEPIASDWVDPGPVVDSVCYPGLYEGWGTCFDVHAPAVLPGGYDYPDRTGQYRPPSAWLDLDSIDSAVMVAPNFELGELAQAHKGQLGVVQPHAVAHLQEVRDTMGPLRVNSGYRSPAYNAGVGGVTTSRHMYGDAFDLAPLSGTLSQLESACYANGAAYVGVYVSHIHCDWRDDPLEEAFYGSSARAAVDHALPELRAQIERDGDWLVAPASGWDEGEPLREWTAYDSRDRVLLHVTATAFAPPDTATRVEVWVGRAIHDEIALR